MRKKKMVEYAPIVLRLGVALVFLWFGITQLTNPAWGLSWLPPWVYGLGIQPKLFVLANGIFETFFGLLLLLGLFTRFTAFILAVHLFGIIFSVGYNDIAVRDFGLMIACIAIFLYGKDTFSLHHHTKKKKH